MNSLNLPTFLLTLRLNEIKATNYSSTQNNRQKDIEEEIMYFFKINQSKLKDKGIFYSHSLDCFYYVHIITNLSNENEKYFLLTGHLITSAIPVYYNFNKLHDEFLSIFGEFKIENIENEEILLNKIEKWNITFNRYVYDLVPDVSNEIYNDTNLEFIKRYFGNNIAEFFYSLILEIPIIITNLNSKQLIDEFKFSISIILPLADFKTNDLMDPTANVYLLNHELQGHLEFEEYFIYDYKNSEYDIKLKEKSFKSLNNIIQNIIEYHEERVVPLENSIMTQIFWNVQKIYGIMALNSEGKVNFSDYLQKDEEELEGILNRVYYKLSIID